MRQIVVFVAMLIPLIATGQSRHYGDVSYAQPNDCSAITSGSNGVNPYAYLFRDLCERTDARNKQSMARILGRPQPSTTVLKVPAHGTPDAQRYGVACMGGLVMLRIKNGWEQALDTDRRYYTCRSN